MKDKKVIHIASLISRSIEKSTTVRKHVAAVIQNGKIQIIRHNTPGIHAEYLAVLDYLKIKKDKKESNTSCKTVIVIRYENGFYKNSKPCHECICKLKNNVKNIIYSTGDRYNPFCKEKIHSLENKWQSNLIRKVKDCVYHR